MSKLNDIDYLTGLIYEYLYQKIPARPIESRSLSTNYLDDMTIIKKMYEGKQLSELINNIFNTNVAYEGFKESAYVFKRLSDPSTDIIIREYDNNQENNPNNSVNVDKIIAYLLSDLVIHKKTKNIMININNFDVKVKDLELFLRKYKDIKLDQKRILSVSIREHFYKLATLHEHLDQDLSVDNLKDVIFQVLNALTVIHSVYPSFRHNNLTIDNILVYRMNEKEVTYKVSDKSYLLNTSCEVKITNFLKSNMKDYIENNGIDENLKEPNKFYDLDMFLESLLGLKLPDEISEFIDRNHEKGINTREILMNDKLFNKENNMQTGGRRRKSKSGKNKRSKSQTKYEMSSKEVEEILNIETPAEETLNFVNKNKNPKLRELAAVEKPESGLRELLGENTHEQQTYNPTSNLPLFQPMDVPGTNLKLSQVEVEQPVINVDIPPPQIPSNGIGGLLNSTATSQPTGLAGIMQRLSANIGAEVVDWELKPKPMDAPPEAPNIATPTFPNKQPNLNVPANIPAIMPNKIPDNLPDVAQLLRNSANTGNGSIRSYMQGFRGGASREIPIYKGNKNSPFESNESKKIKTERYLEEHPEAVQEYKESKYSNQEQKPIYEKEPQRSETKSIFELKVSPELLPQQRPPPLKPAPPENVVKMINYVLPNAIGAQPYPQSINNQIAPPSGQILSHNTYNIQFANPSKVNEFREDILPTRDESLLKYSMNTVAERLIIYQYLRSILVRQADGENINFMNDKSQEAKNLLSYLRILDLQPSKYDKVKNNPLGLLPGRLLVYNSCYPIRVDRANYNVGCAKNNIGVNIRVYQMTIGESLINKYKTLPFKVFEVWREISLYEDIRDNIVKAKESPNFVVLYAYFMTLDTSIDFLKVKRLRNKDIISKDEKNQKKVLNDLYKKEMSEYLVSLQKYSSKDLTRLVEDLDIHTPSNRCLIALTEAGTQDIITWATRQYEDNGLAKKMINTGYHSYEVWMSILFQLYHSLLVMYKHGISYNNFDLEINVKIKSLKTDESNHGFWKYKVNGVDYYVPNYGYMVMIDSGFTNITSNDEGTVDAMRPIDVNDLITVGDTSRTMRMGFSGGMVGGDSNLNDIPYKVYSDNLIIEDKVAIIKNNVVSPPPAPAVTAPVPAVAAPVPAVAAPVPAVAAPVPAVAPAVMSGGNYNLNKFKGGDPKSQNKDKVLLNFKNAFNTDQFDKEYTLNGGIRPDDRIFSMIRYIHDNITKDNLIEVLVDNFKSYMHNRIGTSLKESEMNNLVEADNLRRGELVACLDNNRWGVIVDISDDEYTVYTHNEASGMDDNIKLTKVKYNNADLRRSTVILEQIAKPNQKLNDIDILETYTLDIKK